MENYTFVCEKLKNLLESDPKPNLCTTADVWSTKHKSFMGVTAHWVNFIFLFYYLHNTFTIYYDIFIFQIDENTLTRSSCVLVCRRFCGSHTYEKIAELLHEVLCEFSIEREQLVSTVTDNGSNFVKAFKEFGCEIDWNFQIDDSELNGMNKYIHFS